MQVQSAQPLDRRQVREARNYRIAAGALAAILVGFGLLQLLDVMHV